MTPYNSITFVDNWRLENDSQLQEFIQSGEVEKMLEKVWRQIVLVLGGDGTMLDAIQEHHDTDLPFLWLNFWTIGFLLNEKSVKNEEVFTPMLYPLLKAEISHSECWESKTHYCFNEFDIRSSEAHAIDLHIKIWDEAHMDIKWDGILVVTPGWSTGYNTSAGGPIIPHSNQNIIITPKAPLFPQRISPMVLPDSTEFRIKSQ